MHITDTNVHGWVRSGQGPDNITTSGQGDVRCQVILPFTCVGCCCDILDWAITQTDDFYVYMKTHKRQYFDKFIRKLSMYFIIEI